MVAIIPSIGFAQAPPIDPNCDPIIGCPIDGGVSLLIALGIGIGAKKSYANQKSTLSKKNIDNRK